jgi:hypothetical protein
MERNIRILLFTAFVLILLSSSSLAADAGNERTSWDLVIAPLLLVLGGIGWVIRSSHEKKQKVYDEMIPPILRGAYRRRQEDEKEFNEALCKLWLYGSKKVTEKMEEALKIMHRNPIDGEKMTRAFQEAISEIRKDIHRLWPWWSCRKIKPEDINHIYTEMRNNMIFVYEVKIKG